MHSTYGAIEDENIEEAHRPSPQRRITCGLYFVLPVALFCSMGMAATSATTIFAYQTLLCRNPGNCSPHEKERYSATVALSVTIANFCAVLVLWLVPFLQQGHPKTTLYFWLFARSTGVAILALGVYCESVRIALFGRIFEGCATDNILQLALNTLYVRAQQASQASRLFGISLALYMVGQALGPILAGLFTDFRTSFVIAVLTFALTFTYLFSLPASCIPEKEGEVPVEAASADERGAPTALVKRLLQPLRAAALERRIWGPGAALLLFLAAVSYVYPALLVFTSMRYGFTGKENGWVVSLAAASSSAYLFVVHVLWPRLQPAASTGTDKEPRSVSNASLGNAAASMLLLGGVFPLIGLTTRPWQVFSLTALASMGLSAPSFIKSYAVGLVDNATQTLATLALMETCGALLSPILLGSAQSGRSEASALFVASALIAGALACLFAGAVCSAFPARTTRDE